MSHLATADSDPEFARAQIARFEEATAAHRNLIRHVANSAAALRIPESHFDAARCGIALYGLSPFGEPPAVDGLEPVLRWDSHLAQVRRLEPGESTGYRRAFVAAEPTWIGIVPVGYADGFRRDLTGAQVRVAGEPRRVVGVVSMDALAVELDRELPIGTPVTLVGHGVLLEDHARVADTINYELASRIEYRPDARAAGGARCVSSRRRFSPGKEAWVVGGAVRDELLGREVVDLDIACREPEATARAYAKRSGGAPFPLSERHGAWRVALDGGRTVDFTPLGRRHRGRPRDAGLHDQRDRGAARRR